jgi:two-component system sensor histidine kinase MtrB
VLANLVGNALRHGGSPVTVTAGLQPDSFQPDGQGGGQLAVEVRDHGPGLPPAAIPHVFDRFFKADTARARSEGSGLGLAIAWENARLHGGHIHAGNHPDGGAVFTVNLPVTAPLPPIASASDREHQPSAAIVPGREYQPTAAIVPGREYQPTAAIASLHNNTDS